MSDVNWYRSCRGVRTGAHSLTVTESRTRFLRRKGTRITCAEEKCDLDIRTVNPRFPRVKNHGETIRLFIVCSWPGRQVKKRRWLRLTLKLIVIMLSLAALGALVVLAIAATNGML